MVTPFPLNCPVPGLSGNSESDLGVWGQPTIPRTSPVRTGLWVQSAEELHLGSKLCPRDPQSRTRALTRTNQWKTRPAPLNLAREVSAFSLTDNVPATLLVNKVLWSLRLLKEKWSENRSGVSNSLWPHGLYNPRNSPGQNTGVGSRSRLQGIFPTPGIEPGSSAWQTDSLPAELPGEPLKKERLQILSAKDHPTMIPHGCRNLRGQQSTDLGRMVREGAEGVTGNTAGET